MGIMNFFRYKAIMSPLGNQHVKKSDKLIMASIWIIALILAVPMAVFYEFTYFRDPRTGVKPFCIPYKMSSESRDYDMTKNAFNTTQTSVSERFQWSKFDVYMLLVTLYQYVIPMGILGYMYTAMSLKVNFKNSNFTWFTSHKKVFLAVETQSPWQCSG